MEAVTLYDLNCRVKQALKASFDEPVWITAEITEIQLNRSGHCYLQLADKQAGEENLIATARATIWSFVFRTLRPYFETMTGRSLEKGMQVMLCVEVVFHEVYGYSLNVRDIDPTYTVGDLERRRQEILSRLEEEGVINMNRELQFPLLPKNVAVISSPTAAGLGDFMNQLEGNAEGFRFHVRLFPAVMQGEQTTESVIAALERIYAYEGLFDVVVIIRGGGSQTDLGSFDSYELAANVAQFPLPVIAGIGHERDETIVDRVAHVRVKTPTAAAVFLIDTFRQRAEELNRLSLRLKSAVAATVRDSRGVFDQLRLRVQGRTQLLFERGHSRLETLSVAMRQGVQRLLTENRRRVELAERTLHFADPRKVLERGYSITRVDGVAVKDLSQLRPGAVLETETAGGYIRSEVTGVASGNH